MARMNADPMPLRVLSWNILEGWHAPKAPGQPPRWDKSRLEAAREVVDRYHPDVMVLNEALWCQPRNGYFVDYARQLGFEHAFCDIYDGVWGNAIVSRHPLVNAHRFRIHNRGGLLAEAQKDGWTLRVATYHPHPSRYPHNKASDYIRVVPLEYPHPFVVCGDFNVISPADAPDRAALEKAFERFSRQPHEDVARFIDGGEEVFAALSALGLRDAFPPAHRHATIPTDLLSLDKSSAMRIDHAWVNGRTRVLSARVLVEPATQVASDHYPLLLDLLPD